MIINEENRRKLDTLDRLLACYSADELTAMVEPEVVVAKLKGVTYQMGIFTEMADSIKNSENENAMLRSDLMIVKSDFAMLLKTLNQTAFAYNADFHNLKQKHNIY